MVDKPLVLLTDALSPVQQWNTQLSLETWKTRSFCILRGLEALFAAFSLSYLMVPAITLVIVAKMAKVELNFILESNEFKNNERQEG
jgi:hypothetical protein